MNKEYLDLIYEDEGEEVVEDATVFNDVVLRQEKGLIK